MSAPAAIRVRDLGKRYWIASSGRPPRALDRLGMARRGTPFWAIRHVDLEVGEGEVMGIVGRNGAGKSTLLRVLARITRPNEGRAEIRGTVGALLSVAAGFHPEMTGRENVFLTGTLLGMTEDEVRERFEAIVAMADVETFVDTPVKWYSSGMKVRLGFAVAAQLRHDVMLLDEALALGDEGFHRQAVRTVLDMATAGRSILLVSHELPLVEEICDRVAWLERGRLRLVGPAGDVVAAYRASVAGSGDVGEDDAGPRAVGGALP